MWGTWFTITVSIVGVILLAVGLAVTAAPLFAIAAAMIVLAVLSIFMSGRRQRSDPETARQAKARSESILARGGDAQTAATRPTRSGGAPASGEGR
jgi:uncharacterized membrane protein YphA (DoxX/SURF4 family)